MVHHALMPCATHFCKGFHVSAAAREPKLRVVDALPRTPAGKVDLAAVRELFGVEA